RTSRLAGPLAGSHAHPPAATSAASEGRPHKMRRTIRIIPLPAWFIHACSAYAIKNSFRSQLRARSSHSGATLPIGHITGTIVAVKSTQIAGKHGGEHGRHHSLAVGSPFPLCRQVVGKLGPRARRATKLYCAVYYVVYYAVYYNARKLQAALLA